MSVEGVHLIRFVADQARARAFYSALLDAAPRLDVPGMTEFDLPGGAVLGLMPRSGIERILQRPQPPGSDSELYLVVDDLDACWARAIRAGTEVVQLPTRRDWGHRVGYLLDPDRSLVALACPSSRSEPDDDAVG